MHDKNDGYERKYTYDLIQKNPKGSMPAFEYPWCWLIKENEQPKEVGQILMGMAGLSIFSAGYTDDSMMKLGQPRQLLSCVQEAITQMIESQEVLGTRITSPSQ